MLFESSTDEPFKISTEIPSFTTPTLDFATHSAELAALVDKLYAYKEAYFFKRTTLQTKEEAVLLMKNYTNDLRKMQEKTLARFNLLTTPPKRKTFKKTSVDTVEEKCKNN